MTSWVPSVFGFEFFAAFVAYYMLAGIALAFISLLVDIPLKIENKNKTLYTDVLPLICFPKIYEVETKKVLGKTIEILVLKSEECFNLAG